MDNNRDMIEQFVGSSVVAKRDYPLLDILWTFSYCLPSKTGYHKHGEEFKKWLVITCKRNLRKKHNLSVAQIKEKMTIFIDFLNRMPDFLSYETYDEDRESLCRILMNRTSVMLAESTEERLREISSGLDTQILSFILSYMPVKIQESLRKAEENRAKYESYSDKYELLSDFIIRVNRETGEISHFKIDTKEWTYLCNKMFDQELKEYKFNSKSHRSRTSLLLVSSYQQYDEYSFWQFGDELVKLGIGYWVFWVTGRGYVYIEFIIPKFIYNAMQPYKENLPQIEDISGKISQITEERAKDEWAIADLEDTEVVSEVSEIDIEDSIVSNPGILEEGLEVVGRQFRTSVGPIDILCKDKDENLVVVELKKGIGSFEVVAQIQKYMACVHENLAKGQQVRGIIVAKAYDKQLEYAIKGSKFPIETKIFGDVPPVPENIRYCDNCGKENRVSAKYCANCGKEFWL